MVVDASSLLAILFGEEDRDRHISALCRPERKFMSAVNWLEAAIVVEARKGEAGSRYLNALMADASIEILPFDASQSAVAFEAWRQYGRPRSAAALNLGDCAAYALARSLNQSLLFKGNDFTKTDVASALQY